MAVDKTTVEFEFTVKDNTGKPLIQIKKNADAAEASVKQLGDQGSLAFSRMQSAIITFNQGLDLLGRLSRFAMSSFEGLFRSSIELEKGIAGVSTLFNSTAQSTAMLTQQVVYLQRRFGSDQRDITSAYYEAIASGAVKVDDALSFMIDAQKLAVGGMTTLKVAVSGLTSLLAAYGINAKDAGKINDALFIGAAAGKTNIEELAMSLGVASAMAKASGVSYREYIAAVSAITAGGVQTTEAVTQVRSALMGLSNQTIDMSNALFKLGIASIQTEITQRGLVPTLKKIIGGTDGTTESLTKLFGRVEAVNGVLALTGTTIGKKYTDIMTEMGDTSKRSGEVTEKAFGKMTNTVSFKLDQLKARISTVFIKTNISAMLAPVIDTLNKLVDVFERLYITISKINFAKLANDLASLSVAVGLVATAFKLWTVYLSAGSFLVALEYLTTLGAIMLKDAAIYTLVAAKWVLIAGSIVAVVAALDILIRNLTNLPNLWTLVTVSFTNGLIRFEKAIVATSIGIAKIGLAFVTLMNKFGPTSNQAVIDQQQEVDVLLKEYNDLSKSIETANEAVSNAADNVDLGFFGDIFSTALKAVNDYNKGLDITGAKLKGIGSKDISIPVMPPTIAPKVEIPPLIPSESLKLIGATFGSAAMDFGGVISSVFSKAIMGFGAVIDMFLDVIKKILDFIPNLLNKVADIFTTIVDLPYKLLNAFKNIGSAFGKILSDFIPNVVNALADSFKWADELPEQLFKALERLIERMPEMFQRLAETLPRALMTSLPRMVLMYFTFWIKYVPMILKSIIKGLSDALPEIGRQFSESFKQLINDIAKFFKLAPPFKISTQDAVEGLKKLGDQMQRSASDVFNVTTLDVAGKGMDVANRIRDAINSSTQRAKDIFTRAWNYLEEVWRKLWKDVLNVFTKAWEIIVDIWRAVWDFTIAACTLAWQGITEIWRVVWETTIAIHTATWNLIVTIWRAVWDGSIAISTATWNIIVAIWQTTWDISVAASTATWNLIVAVWRLVWDGSIAASTKTWDAIVTVWRALWDGTISLVTSAWQSIADTISKFKFPDMPSFSWPEIPKPNWFGSMGGYIMPSSGTVMNKVADAYSRSDAGKTIMRATHWQEGGLIPHGNTMNGVLYAANGALTQGTDTVPAMLTPGEFIVNRDAARYNLGLLSFMNKAKAPLSPVAATSNISVIINAKTDLSPEQIRREIIPTLEKELKRKSQDGKFMLATSGLRTNK